MSEKLQLSCALGLLLATTACSGDGGSNNAGQGGSGTGGSSANAGTGSTTTQSGMPMPGKPGEVGGCKMFPADDPWNLDVSAVGVDAAWTKTVQDLVGAANIHPDYGVDGTALYGIPLNVVPEAQALVPVDFVDYADESDPGPYPVPSPDKVMIEGNTPMSCDGDCHLLVIEQGKCQLFEGYACQYQGGWKCSNGARWDLTKVSYGQRPSGWTSADAAGLAIAPGLLRYDEVRAGEITHAIRFTLKCTTDSFVAPATHQAVPGGCDPANGPPMGTRVRLKASFDVSKLSKSAQAVARGMQKYGMILADNGSNFYFQGEANAGWTDTDIEPLKTIPAAAFEVLAMPPLMK